jgi:serine/threonine protein phosphatase PrpC
VQVFEITGADRFLVLASDGLWDELNRKKSAQVATELAKDPNFEMSAKTLSNKLMNECLEVAAKSHGISRQFLGQIRPGPQKRGLVDDITIVVIDLKN